MKDKNYWKEIKKLSKYKADNKIIELEVSNTDEQKTELFAAHYKTVSVINTTRILIIQ